MTLKGIPYPIKNLIIILSVFSHLLTFQFVYNFGCVKLMILLVDPFFFCPILFFKAFATCYFNDCKVFCKITKHNSMLFEVPKKCSLILVIDITLNSFAQNLHSSSQELPCFVGGFIHSTNVHSSAVEGGHGAVCFFRNRKTIVGNKSRIIERIFYQTIYSRILCMKTKHARSCCKNL